MQQADSADPVSAAKAAVRKLMADKEQIEREVESITARLNSGPNPPGLHGNLVDKEGFPRADIDIAGVRQDRQRLACLTNDHKDIMKQIDQALVHLHSLSKASVSGSHAPAALAPMAGHAGQLAATVSQQRQAQDTAGSNSAEPMDTDARPGPSGAPPERALVPFALVDEVSEGSPASSAGIKVNDYMVSFGAVQLPPDQASGVGQGAKLLPAVAQVLQASEGKVVQAVLLRNGEALTLELTPQRWDGRGLLGCHLQPL